MALEPSPLLLGSCVMLEQSLSLSENPCPDFVCYYCLLTMSNSVTRQAPLSMGFSRQEYWSGGCHALLQGIFPTQ